MVIDLVNEEIEKEEYLKALIAFQVLPQQKISAIFSRKQELFKLQRRQRKFTSF